MTAPRILWFRQDLRLADNAAVASAVADGVVLPVFILDDEAAGHWRYGAAARWWLHHSLASLDRDLTARGAPLLLRRGSAEAILPALALEIGAAEVHAGQLYEPWARERDRRISEALDQAGVRFCRHRNVLLHDPWSIWTRAGGPFSVYTPFSRACTEAGASQPGPAAPERIESVSRRPESDRLDNWGLLPTKPDWAGGLRETWQPGEAGARARLHAFLEEGMAGYGNERNRPDIASTSRLSPHLRWGEIGPATVWAAAEANATQPTRRRDGIDTFRKELLWREFSYHLLWHRPDMPDEPLREQFACFPWREDADQFRAWTKGRTGYPIVDAGMRQLWQTGWMHNRVRMITASFLIKHLLLPWQKGAAWFWDTLVDADLASNSASWQWVAGSGADAAPYFRIFNPILQGLKFDASGAYVRRFVPELARLPDEFIHRPWEAPALLLREAGVELGKDYPEPIVDHDSARRRALAALASTNAEAI